MPTGVAGGFLRSVDAGNAKAPAVRRGMNIITAYLLRRVNTCVVFYDFSERNAQRHNVIENRL